MAKAHIQLALTYKESKIRYPVYVSEKIDGVPLAFRFSHSKHFGWMPGGLPTTRPGKTAVSATPLHANIARVLERVPDLQKYGVVELIGETTHPDYPEFKDVSGIVRRQEPCSELVFNGFDLIVKDKHGTVIPFEERYALLEQVGIAAATFGDAWPARSVNVISQWLSHDAEDVRLAMSAINIESKAVRLEGYVFRDPKDSHVPGARNSGYMKLVVRPTLDLLVVGFDEATDAKTGEPKGMVGRVNVIYKGKLEGVGPGKLTHKERTALWQQYGSATVNRVAEVSYKHDPSYNGIREGTFQHWRDDKTVGETDD